MSAELPEGWTPHFSGYRHVNALGGCHVELKADQLHVSDVYVDVNDPRGFSIPLQVVFALLASQGLEVVPVVRPMKCRPCGGGMSIDEAMERVFEIHGGWPFLVGWLKQHYHYRNPTEENITVQFYATDPRIGWKTHLVCIDGQAALYTDSMPDGIPEHAKRPGREPIY